MEGVGKDSWCLVLALLVALSTRTALASGSHARQGLTSQLHLRQQNGPGQHLARVVADPEPTILDFSDDDSFGNKWRRQSPSAVNLAAGDPYEANPKNGTPWYRYTRTAGRGQADHEHFDGLVATNDFPEDILTAHNVVRERAGIAPLAWHGRLAEMASARVLKLANEGCYIQHSPLKDRWYEAGFEYIGENLYKVINMKPTGVDIVDAWYAELEDYTYGPVGSPCVKARCVGRTNPPCTLGHFTQVMWAKSTHLGCARAECPNQEKRTFVAVCNYGPGGNIVGYYPFPAAAAPKMDLESRDCRMPRPNKDLWDKVRDVGRKADPTVHGGSLHASPSLLLLLPLSNFLWKSGLP